MTDSLSFDTIAFVYLPRVKIIRRCLNVITCAIQADRLLFTCSFLCLVGVISAGVSVPVQIPSQGPDLASNYWGRLQWSQLFGFPHRLLSMPENPTNVPESPSSSDIAHNYADSHLSMNALNMTAGHDANVLAVDMQQENNSVS